MAPKKSFYPTDAATAVAKGATLVTVEATMAHLARYGRDTAVRLTYAAKFPVRFGMRVLLPPTPSHPQWTKGRIVAVGNDYTGKVKYLAAMPQPNFS